MALNDEQARVVEFISRGHNCLITGHAGSGKSRVVNSIIQYCYEKNLKVGVVCSSGIACKVYAKGLASTVHAYYGLGIADLPSKQVIERATRNSLVVERIRDVDVIIWDEASMSSARMLELVNCLHHELTRTECGKFYPFGGKQIVLVGEFLQLRPVPGKFDDGRFMFLSNVFEFAIPHRIQLNQIMRQSAGEERFIEALQQLRLGLCSQETSKFLTDLSRDLPSELRREATHIFFKNSPAILHNRSIVDDLPGEIIRLHATFEGHSKHMKWPGQETLLLKNGCKVMLVWNKSATLKNGSVGTFEGMTSNGMAKVNFDSEGTVLINKDSWLNRDVQGQVSQYPYGSVSQYPLVVAYAVTSHKSQALTVPAVVVHCTNEFVPGLTYVAASRVRSADHLQMLNFQPRQLLKPPPSVVEQCSTWIADPKPDLSCCRNKRVTDDQFFEVTERQSQREFDGEEIQFPMEQIDNLVSSYFEVPGQVVPVELSVVYNQLARHVSELAKPPRDLIDSSMHAMLQALHQHYLVLQLSIHGESLIGEC